MSTLTTENYVKAIYQLGGIEGKETVATGAIASKLQISPGSVSAMLKTLRDAELVQYAPYEGVMLTESGKKLALRVLRRHRLIELFLSKTLELEWDEVHEEAENMEHAVSDRLIDRIDAFLDFPQADPHGDPIPKSDGTVEAFGGTPLGDWPADKPFRLIRVLDQSGEFLRFLTDAGLKLSAVGHVVCHQVHASIVEVKVDDKTTVLSGNVAEKLLVVDA